MKFRVLLALLLVFTLASSSGGVESWLSSMLSSSQSSIIASTSISPTTTFTSESIAGLDETSSSESSSSSRLASTSSSEVSSSESSSSSSESSKPTTTSEDSTTTTLILIEQNSTHYTIGGKVFNRKNYDDKIILDVQNLSICGDCGAGTACYSIKINITKNIPGHHDVRIETFMHGYALTDVNTGLPLPDKTIHDITKGVYNLNLSFACPPSFIYKDEVGKFDMRYIIDEMYLLIDDPYATGTGRDDYLHTGKSSYRTQQQRDWYANASSGFDEDQKNSIGSSPGGSTSIYDDGDFCLWASHGWASNLQVEYCNGTSLCTLLGNFRNREMPASFTTDGYLSFFNDTTLNFTTYDFRGDPPACAFTCIVQLDAARDNKFNPVQIGSEMFVCDSGRDLYGVTYATCTENWKANDVCGDTRTAPADDDLGFIATRNTATWSFVNITTNPGVTHCYTTFDQDDEMSERGYIFNNSFFTTNRTHLIKIDRDCSMVWAFDLAGETQEEHLYAFSDMDESAWIYSNNTPHYSPTVGTGGQPIERIVVTGTSTPAAAALTITTHNCTGFYFGATAEDQLSGAFVDQKYLYLGCANSTTVNMGLIEIYDKLTGAIVAGIGGIQTTRNAIPHIFFNSIYGRPMLGIQETSGFQTYNFTDANTFTTALSSSSSSSSSTTSSSESSSSSSTSSTSMGSSSTSSSSRSSSSSSSSTSSTSMGSSSTSSSVASSSSSSSSTSSTSMGSSSTSSSVSSSSSSSTSSTSMGSSSTSSSVASSSSSSSTSSTSMGSSSTSSSVASSSSSSSTSSTSMGSSSVSSSSESSSSESSSSESSSSEASSSSESSSSESSSSESSSSESSSSAESSSSSSSTSSSSSSVPEPRVGGGGGGGGGATGRSVTDLTPDEGDYTDINPPSSLVNVFYGEEGFIDAGAILEFIAENKTILFLLFLLAICILAL